MTTDNECCDDVLTIKSLSVSARHSLKSLIIREGFKSYKVNVKDVSTDGGNYLGMLQSVNINGKTVDGNKELNLFLKNTIAVDETNSVLNISDAYLREGLFYKELFNIFQKIEDKYNVPREEGLNFVKGYSETNGEVIIMEDISKAGFKTYDRFDVVPLKFVELAVEQLAKLHAMSFILQKENPVYFKNNIKPLRALVVYNNNFETHVKHILKITLEYLEGEAKTKFDDYFKTVIEKHRKYNDVPEDKAVCLIHGDFRANNILVKEIEGEAAKVIPVDYQFACYGYPVADLIYFIFTATDKQFREAHLENIKELYYNTFEVFLNKFGIEATEVYCRKRFEKDYTDMLDHGLICFLIIMPFLFSKSDNIPNFEDGTENLTYNLDPCCKERVREIVDEFINWGYL